MRARELKCVYENHTYVTSSSYLARGSGALIFHKLFHIEIQRNVTQLPSVRI